MADPEGWMDLGDCLAGGYNVVWCCGRCYHGAEVPAETMIARYGPAKTLHDLDREGRCKVDGCGSPGRVFTRSKVMPTPSNSHPDGNANFSTPGGHRTPIA